MPVSLDARFAAASEELSARLSIRQSIAIGFTAAAIPLIAVLVAPGAVSSVSTSLRLYGSLALSALALAFSLWYLHQDLSIGLLSKFLKHCERADEGHALPGWHSTGDWMRQALSLRKLSDYAFSTVLLVTAVPSVVIALQGHLSRWDLALTSIGVVLPLLASALVIRSGNLRRQLQEE